MRPGQVERHTHDYVRHGTTDLFAALDICSGRVVGECRARHTAEDFRAFLDTIDRTVPDDLEVHVILDNAATHKTPLIHRWLAQRPRYHLHFTPTSASWLNMVEGWFALLTRRQLRRGAFRSTQALEAAIRRYIEISNTDPKPFVWTKTADDILDSIKRFCQRTSNSRHKVLLQASLEVSPQSEGQAVAVGSWLVEFVAQPMAIGQGQRPVGGELSVQGGAELENPQVFAAVRGPQIAVNRVDV